jgi:prefoldin subunit 5
LTKLQGSALSDVDRQRQQLETQLKEEQDAIRRASERLQQLQQGQKPQ